jgi:probable HAF family extracellular repeat protein
MSHITSRSKRAMALLLALLTLPVAVLGASRSQFTSLSAHLGNLPWRQHAYSVIELGSFGGTNCCVVIEINNRSWVDGTSNFPENKNFHPFLWLNGRMVDLGTLGGPNSSAGGSNDRGDVTVGGSDTRVPDPLGEDFCTYGTYQICRSFVWHNGVRLLVPTLGGNNSDVAGINNNGEVLGFGETANHDPTCIAPQVLGIKAFTWEPTTGEVHILPPLSGDSDSVGFGLNENGQVAGASGICKGGLSSGLAGARHAVLWQNGTPIDLGSLWGCDRQRCVWH